MKSQPRGGQTSSSDLRSASTPIHAATTAAAHAALDDRAVERRPGEAAERRACGNDRYTPAIALTAFTQIERERLITAIRAAPLRARAVAASSQNCQKASRQARR